MKRFVDTHTLVRATLWGVLLHVVLALLAHFSTWVAENLYMFGWMMCSATAGYLYGMWIGRSYALGALGGAIAGGVSALPVIVLTVLVGDSEAAMVSVGPGVCILTGGVGGAFGHMSAIMRKLGL